MKSRFLTPQQLFRPKCLLAQWTLWTKDTFNVILNSERMSVIVVVMLEDVSEVLAVCWQHQLVGEHLAVVPGHQAHIVEAVWCSEHGEGFGNIGIKSFHFIQNFSDILQWAFWFKEYITDSKMCRYYFKPRDQAKWNGWNSPLAIGRGMAHRLLYTFLTVPWGLGPCHCLVWAALHTVCSAPI